MKLPESWVIVPIASVCEINPKIKAKEKPNDDTIVSFVPMSAVDESSATIAQPELRKYSEVSKGYSYFRPHDVIFAKVTPCMENGKVAIARELENGLGFGSTEFHVLRPSEMIHPEYLLFFLRQSHFREFAKSSYVGTGGLQRVPPVFFDRAKIPLPTMPEQQQIAKILQHVEYLKAAKDSVVENSIALSLILFEKTFGIAGETKKWPMEQFGNHVTYSKYGPRFHDAQYSEKGIHILRTTDMNRDGTIRWWESPKLDLSEKQIGEHVLKPETLIISRSGTIGPFALYDGPKGKCIAGAYLIEFGISNSLEGEYIRTLFMTPYMQLMLQRASRSAALPNINAPAIKAIKIPVPPINMQREFSEKIRALRLWQKEVESSKIKINNFATEFNIQAINGKLTDNWRNRNKKKIIEFISIRDKELGKISKQAIRKHKEDEILREKEARVFRSALFKELSAFQKSVRNALKKKDRILIPDDTNSLDSFSKELTTTNDSNIQDRVIRALDQLATLGLVAKVSLPNEQGHYLNGFRMLREGESRRVADIQTVNAAMKSLEEQKVTG